MTKYHVTDDGRVLPCSANVNACSYSKAEDGNRHFTDPKLAEKKASELLLQTYDAFNSVSKKSQDNKKMKDELTPRLRKRSTTSSVHKGRGISLQGLDKNPFRNVPQPASGPAFDDFRQSL